MAITKEGKKRRKKHTQWNDSTKKDRSHYIEVGIEPIMGILQVL